MSGDGVTRSGWVSSSGRLLGGVRLGLVGWLVPPELIDEVLVVTGRAETRFRVLPSRLGVYFVLGLCLFSGKSYGQVLRRMIGGSAVGLAGVGWRVPCSTALTKLRRRLGPVPFEVLFHRLCRVWPSVPASWSHAFGLVVVAWDGTCVDVADSAANRAWFGGPKNKGGVVGYPQARLVTLMTCGTRRIIDTAIGRYGEGERVLAGRLLGSLRPGLLVLADRGFPSFRLWAQTTATGAEALWRVTSTWSLDFVAWLPDGSYLARMNDPVEVRAWRRKVARARKTGRRLPRRPVFTSVTVRVVEATITVTTTGQPDSSDGGGERYRLMTTILDPDTAPAGDLVALYGRRWACELGIREIKTYLRGHGRVLRATDPGCVEQELWAYLITYELIRLIIHRSALTADLDPAQISFTAALSAVQDAIHITPRTAVRHADVLGHDLAQNLITKHLTHRICPRALKRARLSSFPLKREDKHPTRRNVTYQITLTKPITNPTPKHQHPSPAQPRAT